MAEVWKAHDHQDTRTVDVHVRRLRGKRGTDLPLIVTVRGFGYRIGDTGQISVEY